MRERALVLAITLSLAGVAASEEKPRPLHPTEEELERFELPAREIEGMKPFPESSALFRISGIGMFGVSAADLATTELGLARGLSEGNPSLRIAGFGWFTTWWGRRRSSGPPSN
jgi:hypothetical protein